VRQGNVYPTLTQQQLDQMRQRRLTSNCTPSQLLHKEPAAHQAKHIMLCRCAETQQLPTSAAAGGLQRVICTAYTQLAAAGS
jgi:hypothetical protein